MVVGISLIIGEVDWKPVSELDPESAEYALAQNVGVLYAGGSRCTGWVYDNSVYTAGHCLPDSGRARLQVGNETLELYFSDCSVWDICRDTHQFSKSSVMMYAKERREAYLLHQQEGEILISPNCSYWRKNANRVYHTCDSYYGSSGGMLVDAETNTPIAVHTGGYPDDMVNVATKLSVLD